MPERLAVVMAVVVMAVAACGGDGAGESGELTRAEWVESANAVCAAMFDQLDLVPEPRSPEEMGEAGRQVTEIHRTALAELRALVPPDGEEETIDQILEAAEATIDWGLEFTQAVAAGEEAKAATLLEDGERLAAESDRLFADYGLVECLEPGE